MNRMSSETSANPAAAGSLSFGAKTYRSDLEIIPPGDTRKRRRHTDDPPFRYVCQLRWVHRGIQATGTGTLIGPRTLLTVGHNLVDGRGASGPLIVPPHAIVVRPGLDAGFAPFPESRARRFVFFPGFVVRNAAGDIQSFRSSTSLDLAIVELEQPIGDTVGFWGERPRPSNDFLGSTIEGRLPISADRLKVNLSGYPSDKPDGTQWGSFNHLRRIEDGLLLYENDTATGHSGSPVWIKRHRTHGGRIMIGVHVRRFRVDSRPTLNAAVHLDQERIDFIERNTS